jgi:hypothetical protein
MTREAFERRSCDRCGFTVETQVRGQGNPEGWTQVTTRAFGLPASGGDGPTADLCPDCCGSLIAWMNEGKVAAGISKSNRQKPSRLSTGVKQETP